MQIKTVRDLVTAFRQGRFSSVGGYPLFFVTHDGQVLCWRAVRDNFWRIARAVRDSDNNGWRVVALDVNWEDPALFCDDTGERIESAYAEDQADQDA
jgi:hypothetical protein